jgi:hypothetical protein
MFKLQFVNGGYCSNLIFVVGHLLIKSYNIHLLIGIKSIYVQDIKINHSRACPLIGSFFSCVYLLWRRERYSDRNITFRCSFIGYFLSRVSYCNNRERAFIFVYDTKEKENQNTRQSDLYSGAIPNVSMHVLLLIDMCSSCLYKKTRQLMYFNNHCFFLVTVYLY